MRSFRQVAKSAALSTATVALLVAAPACGRDAGQQSYHLPSQPLAAALRAVSEASGISIVAQAELVEGRTAPSLDGTYTPDAAVAALLAGSGLQAKHVGDGLIIALASPEGLPGASVKGTDNQILVTGSRIRGAPVAAPVIRVGSEQIRNTGQADLGEFARSVPQSFGGGQNPGIGFNVPSGTGGNIGGGSSFNLRGLGSDATLTLLNGRRLPYDSSRQGIDVSAIPLAAVDRVEIVADGSSALYGSDAVGGVVNVILKRDFEGIETRAQLGGSTDGGDFRQQYGAMAGARWRGGGGFVTYEYEDNTAIRASDRDYAASRPGITLLPGGRRHAVAGSAHQQLSDDLSLDVDALFNQRSSATTYPLNFAGDLTISRTVQSFNALSYAFAGSLGWSLDSWRVNLIGTYGRNRTRFRGDTFFNDTFSSSAGGRYDNRSATGELGADGPLFTLPGGAAKLALGAGVRNNDFGLFRGAGAVQNINASQDVLYAFGELSLPVIAPEQDIPFARRLNLSGALRYERYHGIAEVVTPKLGLLYSPADVVDFKATWGRSFRAPSFIQRYQVQQALLYPATTFGGTGYPAGSTALLRVGGNPDLKPERARSWSATIALHPPSLAGATLELSYFSTRYVDRIVNPIPLLALALADPAYRDRITLAPTTDEQAATIGAASQFINVTGAAYDPAKVVAIVNSANVNAGRQSIQGLDALLRIRTDTPGGSLEGTLDATYLDSEQQLAPGLPVQPLAGALFNPPHWRMRGTLTWTRGSLLLTSTLSYLGGVFDRRTSPGLRIGGMTTADLTARYRFAERRGPLSGLELSLSVQNVFNDKPSTIATSVFYDTPYDSTNYSAVGRFVAIGVAKRW